MDPLDDVNVVYDNEFPEDIKECVKAVLSNNPELWFIEARTMDGKTVLIHRGPHPPPPSSIRLYFCSDSSHSQHSPIMSHLSARAADCGDRCGSRGPDFAFSNISVSRQRVQLANLPLITAPCRALSCALAPKASFHDPVTSKAAYREMSIGTDPIASRERVVPPNSSSLVRGRL